MNRVDEHMQGIGRSPVNLLLSLPFCPTGTRSLHFWGHIALDIEGTTFQVFDPRALRAPFLVSKMPTAQWLFGRSRLWVHRDRQAAQYRHVYLYGVGEALRTTVYYTGLQVTTEGVYKIRRSFRAIDDRFEQTALQFQLRKQNCSSLVAGVLTEASIIPAGARDHIPFAFFSRLARSHGTTLGAIDERDRRAFRLRRFCVGAGIGHPAKVLNRQLAAGPQADDRRRAAAVTT